MRLKAFTRTRLRLDLHPFFLNCIVARSGALAQRWPYSSRPRCCGCILRVLARNGSRPANRSPAQSPAAEPDTLHQHERSPGQNSACVFHAPPTQEAFHTHIIPARLPFHCTLLPPILRGRDRLQAAASNRNRVVTSASCPPFSQQRTHGVFVKLLPNTACNVQRLSHEVHEWLFPFSCWSLQFLPS